MELLLNKRLRSVWYLFCLFFVFYTYKAVSSSAAEFKNDSESIAVEVPPDDEHTGAASVIRNRRAPENNYSFSTITIIKPYVSSSNTLSTIASLQWIGSPPYQVSYTLRALPSF